MAGDLTLDANLRFKGPVYTEKFIMDSTATVHVYRGQPIIIDQNVDTNHVVAFTDAVTTVASTDVCVGIACEPHIITAGDPETVEINVYTWPTIVGFKMASATTYTNEDLGKSMYLSGSGTLAQSATGNPLVGTVFTVEDGYCYIKLSTPVICSGA